VHTGAVSTFAEGLPLMNTPPGIGGAIDVAFVGRTAYVLVANVGPVPWGEDEVAGIYRIGRDGRGTPTSVAITHRDRVRGDARRQGPQDQGRPLARGQAAAATTGARRSSATA
jgi:hypothetical protein